MNVPRPHNESARIRALQQYEFLESWEEKAFDDMTMLAALICATPVAMITQPCGASTVNTSSRRR